MRHHMDGAGQSTRRNI